MREHPGFAVHGGGAVGSGPVEVDRADGSLKGRQPAGQQGAGHTGQHIAAAPARQAGVAGWVHRAPAILGRNDRLRPLEHDHGVPRSGKPQGGALPVGVDGRSGQPGQPGHLAGVGC